MDIEGWLFLGLLIVTGGMWWNVISVLTHLDKQYKQTFQSQQANATANEEYTETWKAMANCGHETNLKGNELIVETNRLLRELIDEVRNERPASATGDDHVRDEA